MNSCVVEALSASELTVIEKKDILCTVIDSITPLEEDGQDVYAITLRAPDTAQRVTNRWGYVSATTPERSMAQLEAKLPREYFVEINRLLVPFGKHVCTGALPKCSTCPVLEFCRQVGVDRHR